MAPATLEHATLGDELAQLIDAQAKDDTYTISRPNEISMNARLPSGDTVADLIGVDENGEILDFTPRDPTPIGAGRCGSVASYNAGCKCSSCRQAKADYMSAYMRSYRARKRAEALA